MKLIQLNAWGGRLEYRLNDFIEAQQPDILCLQEIIDIKNARGALFTSVEEICEILKTKHYYMSPILSFNFMRRKANFGNAIISKYPILKNETIFTGREYLDDFDWTEHTMNIRNLQYAEVELPNGKLLNLFNHHGHHIHEHKNGDEESMRQMKLVAEEIKQKDGKVILTGDFNLIPESESLQQINKILNNLSVKAGLATTRNQLTHKTEVCDYIFVSDEIEDKSFKMPEEIVSDHQALILNFD